MLQRKGLCFVVIFPRQSGKNELQAQIETYLLSRCQLLDAEIVKVSPTWKPQTLNAMRRLERVIARNITTRGKWKKESRVYLPGGSSTDLLSFRRSDRQCRWRNRVNSTRVRRSAGCDDREMGQGLRADGSQHERTRVSIGERSGPARHCSPGRCATARRKSRKTESSEYS